MGLAGKVFVEFVIDTDGSVIDVAILRGSVYGLLRHYLIRQMVERACSAASGT